MYLHKNGSFDYLQSEDQIASDFFSISLKVDMRKDSLKLWILMVPGILWWKLHSIKGYPTCP